MPDYNFNHQYVDEIIKKNIIENTFEYSQYQKLIETFINLFKGRNYKLDDLNKFIKNEKDKNKYNQKRNKKLLKVIKKIYMKYEYTLIKNNEIDFNDMINKAINHLKTNKYKNYKYIIVDEFQDTSLVKCNFLQELQKQNNAYIMAVGDDWQSIYNFTGCDICNFINFKKIFKHAKILKIKNTYRNSKQLLKITSNFIQKNPNQIRKKLMSNKINKKPIKIIYYKKNINEVITQVFDLVNTKEILLLTRNNNDINILKTNKKLKINDDCIIYKNKKIKYMTIHKSKGLETGNTIIINLENKVTGLPNKIQNDPILRYVTSKAMYQYEEERRLFYVALTRTKNSNYLIINKSNPSIFINEITRYKKNIEYIKTKFDK